MADIFFSYRHEGREALCRLIYKKLTNREYDVFYDIEDIINGPFPDKLYRKIESYTDNDVYKTNVVENRYTFWDTFYATYIEHSCSVLTLYRNTSQKKEYSTPQPQL